MERSLTGKVPETSGGKVNRPADQQQPSCANDLVKLLFMHNLTFDSTDICITEAKSPAQDTRSKNYRPLIEQLWGLPPTEPHLSQELDVATREGIQLLWQLDRSGLQIVESKAGRTALKTLARVHWLLYGEDPERDHSVESLGQRIADKFSALGPLNKKTSLLLCTLSVCSLLQRNFPAALSLLDAAEKILLKDDKERNDEDDLKHGTLEGGSDLIVNVPSTAVHGILAYLKVCSFIQAEDWSRSLHVIGSKLNSIPHQLQVQTQYLRAYSLYHAGNYDVAMATCQTLLETISGSGRGAHAHNLIGCCLRQKEKPHMALQQFRNALSSHPSVFSPALFNISVIYRDLEQGDAEIESLGLLEKVLGAKHKDEAVDPNNETLAGPIEAWPAVLLVPTPLAQASPAVLPVLAPGLAPALAPASSGNQSRPGLLPAIGPIPALYQLARRCMDLKRNEIAAERFLDLLSTLQGTSVFSGSSFLGSPTLMPSLQTIHLEAATALLRVGRLEEALAVCDKLLSKSRLVGHHVAETSLDVLTESDNGMSSEDEGPLSHNGPPSHDRSKLPSVKGSKAEEDNAGSVNRARVNVSAAPHGRRRHGNPSFVFPDNGRQEDMAKFSKTSCSSEGSRKERFSSDTADRKRRREVDRNESHSAAATSKTHTTDDTKEGNILIDKGEEEMYTAHALILQARCLVRQGDATAAAEVVDWCLGILQDSSGEECSEMEAAKEEAEESKPKKRRVGSDSAQSHFHSGEAGVGEGTSTDESPLNTLSLLKTTAYQVKASILMSQNKLQDAMKQALLSLQCCPNNVDTLKTHAVLLEKLGRKNEAVKAWSRLKETKSRDNAVHSL